MSDEEILKLLKARKQEGLSHILDQYQGLMTYIVKNTGIFNEEDVAECMSDILYTLWKRIHKYDKSKSSFKTWLIMVTRGCAIDYLRRNKKYGQVISFDEIGDIADAARVFRERDDNTVISFLQALTPPDNEIFYRRFILGESVAAIAEMLDLTQDNVYKRLSRGKEKLKTLMGREGNGYV